MSTDAVTAEKLQAVYDNSEKVKELNTELESILYGADTDGKSWYDFFWDNFQNSGNRTHYEYGFYTSIWTDDIFKPKYDISPTNAAHIFRATKIKDVRPETVGVNIDFSKATTTQGAFNGAFTKYVGIVDLSSITGSNAAQMFGYNYYTESIEKLIVHENMLFTSFFQNSNAFKNIIIEGVIGSSFSISSSAMLTLESAISIITHLKDYSTDTTNAYKHTVSFSSKTIALLEADGNASPNGTTWLEYIAELGWNCA